MEISSKRKAFKRKNKKKVRVINNSLLPVLKPGKFDGLSNWLKMQKILGPVTNTVLKKPDEKHKFTGKKLNKDKPHPILQTKSFQSDTKKENAADVKNDRSSYNSVDGNVDTVQKKSYANVVSQHIKTDSYADKTEPFAFKFNESNTSYMQQDFENNVESIDASQVTDSDKKLTKAVAMDCEMVGTGPTGEDSVIARVSIVNIYGDCLYDEYVKPKENITDFRTQISGIRPSDLKNGKDLFDVQKDVLAIIEGKILVGHALKHDLKVLFITHPKKLLRDTAYYKPFRDLCNGKTPSLKKLASLVLGCDIQTGEHSSIEDAQAAMLLYLRQKHDWERQEKLKEKRRLKSKKKYAVPDDPLN